MITHLRLIYLLALLVSSLGCGYQQVGEENHDSSELSWDKRNKRIGQRSGSLFGRGHAAPSTDSQMGAAAAQKIDLKYPVVFHHGFMGGTGMGMNMPAAEVLQAQGLKVYRTEVSPANSIAYRAKQLGTQIDDILRKSGSQKVNIIAHSMGGLDSRYLISSMGYSNRVASLTTIATPHRGTPLADIALSSGRGNKVLNLFVTLASKGINSNSTLQNNNLNAALNDLRPSFMENTFNPQNPDKEGVYYQSYAGVSGRDSEDRLTLLLLLSHNMIRKTHGANDGVVPLSSAKWSNFKGQLAADHIDLSGFRNLSQTAMNYENFIVTITRDLSNRGF